MNEAPGDAPTRSTIHLGQPLVDLDLNGVAAEVRSVTVSLDDRFLTAALASHHEFYVYDMQDSSEGPHARLEVKHFAMYGVFSPKVDPSEPNARLLACCIGAPGNRVEFHKFDVAIRKFEHVMSFEDHASAVYMGTFEPSGSFFWSGSYDGTVRCFDIALGTCVYSYNVKEHFKEVMVVYSFSFSSDWSLLAIRTSADRLIAADARLADDSSEHAVVDECSFREVLGEREGERVKSYAVSAAGDLIALRVGDNVLVLCDRHGSEICRMPMCNVGGDDPGALWMQSDLLFAPLMPYLLILGNGYVMNVASAITARKPLSQEDEVARLPVVYSVNSSVRRVCYISPGSTYCVLWSARMKLVQVYRCPSLLNCLDGCVAFAQGLSSPESPISTVLGGNALFDRNVLGVVFSFLSGSSFGDSDS